MATDDLRIDWNLDDDFDDAGEDVTSRVLARDPVQIRYGRDQARGTAPVAVGEMSFSLNNVSRDYSPENGSSPLAGDLVPGRPVRYQRTHASTTYTLFRGFLDDFTVNPNPGDWSVSFNCLDLLARLREAKISTALYQGIHTGTAVGHVLDAIDWPAPDRDIDTGLTIIPWWWEEGTSAFDALVRITNSEGPPALFHVGPDGELVFRDRHHRFTEAASLTSQATYSDTGAEPKFSAPLVYDHGWREVYNDVSFTVEERAQYFRLQDVWTTDDEVISLGSGASTVRHVSTTDPFTGAVTPVAGTDYEILSGTVSIGLSRTSGASTIITVTATSGTPSIRGLKLRAYPVPVSRSVLITDSDSTSATAYGVRSWPNDAPFAGIHDAQAIGEIVLARYANRLPTVQLAVRSGRGQDTRLTAQLARDLSDRVTVVDAETGLNDEFFVEQIAHTVSSAGLIQETTFGCEKAPTELVAVADLLTFGGGDGHWFGEGRFAA